MVPVCCKWVRPAVGVALCAVAAEGLTLAFDSTPFTVFLPLIFLGIIILVALRFGNASGVIGTIVAALTFAVFLFEPTLSLEVKNSAERSNLNLDGLRHFADYTRAARRPSLFVAVADVAI